MLKSLGGGVSLAGKAPVSHTGDHRFESDTLHHFMQLDPLTKSAIQHTLHCLLGCSIGEVLGMAVSTALKWSNFGNIVLSIILAFFFGYLLTIRSIRHHGARTKSAIKTALVTDTVSITSMEIVDNGF